MQSYDRLHPTHQKQPSNPQQSWGVLFCKAKKFEVFWLLGGTQPFGLCEVFASWPAMCTHLPGHARQSLVPTTHGHTLGQNSRVIFHARGKAFTGEMVGEFLGGCELGVGWGTYSHEKSQKFGFFGREFGESASGGVCLATQGDAGSLLRKVNRNNYLLHR